jgi:hypothetical protein
MSWHGWKAFGLLRAMPHPDSPQRPRPQRKTEWGEHSESLNDSNYYGIL